MIINRIETMRLSVPLKSPFKTALRTVVTAESIIVKITCNNGVQGWGEAPPTHVITGDSLEGIEGAIHHIFKPLLLGKNLLAYESVFQDVHQSAIGNTSSKAAIDMAIYDCLAQNSNLPLYQFLGGDRNRLETDFTVSVNSPDEMGEDAERYVSEGFTTLKVKVGKDDASKDLARLQAIRGRVGPDIKIRIDANQGWTAKEAISMIHKMESMGLEIELVEQPVHKDDVEGLKKVTDSVDTPIMADESVFSPQDALKVMQTRSADLINIKLMKAGGIHKALLISKMAELYGVECMVGSMIESKLGITAAAHFAASQKNITRFDFDAPLMLSKDIFVGGIQYNGKELILSDDSGLGIKGMREGGLIG